MFHDSIPHVDRLIDKWMSVSGTEIEGDMFWPYLRYILFLRCYMLYVGNGPTCTSKPWQSIQLTCTCWAPVSLHLYQVIVCFYAKYAWHNLAIGWCDHRYSQMLGGYICLCIIYSVNFQYPEPDGNPIAIATCDCNNLPRFIVFCCGEWRSYAD